MEKGWSWPPKQTQNLNWFADQTINAQTLARTYFDEKTVHIFKF